MPPAFFDYYFTKNKFCSLEEKEERVRQAVEQIQRRQGVTSRPAMETAVPPTDSSGATQTVALTGATVSWPEDKAPALLRQGTRPLAVYGQSSSARLAKVNRMALEYSKHVKVLSLSACPIDVLLGAFVASGRSVIFEWGPFPIFFSQGGVLILEDVELASVSVLQLLESIISSKSLPSFPQGSLEDAKHQVILHQHAQFRLVLMLEQNKQKELRRLSSLLNKCHSVRLKETLFDVMVNKTVHPSIVEFLPSMRQFVEHLLAEKAIQPNETCPVRVSEAQMWSWSHFASSAMSLFPNSAPKDVVVHTGVLALLARIGFSNPSKYDQAKLALDSRLARASVSEPVLSLPVADEKMMGLVLPTCCRFRIDPLGNSVGSVSADSDFQDADV